MADLVVGMAKSVVDGALTKAQAAIEEEAKLRTSAQRNLVFITGEFQMMLSFLNVADGDRLNNVVVRTWVRQIRDLAYDVEDCIEFVVHLDKRNRWWLRLLEPWRWLTPAGCLAPLELDEAVAELERLKARVDDVSSRNSRYNLIINDSSTKPAAAEQQLASGDAVCATEFDRLIVSGTKKGCLTQLVLKEESGHLRVISAWGSGGDDLGMTPIVWDAYTDTETCRKFACRAWVKLRRPFNSQEFVQSLMAQFIASTCEQQPGTIVALDVGKKMEEAKQSDLLAEFAKYVNKKRFLVVFEDLSTMEEWNAITTFFPKGGNNGSTIILSTVNFEVASLSVGHPYRVLHLYKMSAKHSVYAFYKTGSESEHGVHREKKEAAQKWIEHNHLAGRSSEINDLKQRVSLANARSYQVMSVWGIAGVGKSALVKHMFCDKIFNTKLPTKFAWVDIIQPFSLSDFARSLLWSFGSEGVETKGSEDLDTLGSKNPIAECHDILQNNSERRFIVIDGLQATKEWDLIQAELVSGSNPARTFIIVITSDESIATHCCGPKVPLKYNVKGLDPEAAFSLLCKVSGMGTPRADDVEVLRELIARCGGLPKIIVEIAKIIAKKRYGKMDEARSINNKFMETLQTNKQFGGLQGLFHSMQNYYRSCPDFLKPCIYYLSIFCPDQLIRRRRLVRRWVAEGYSRGSHDESAEENGEKQFLDLLNLCIIEQPSNLELGGTRMVQCQVNRFFFPLFRNYIISQQMEENLVFELDDSCIVTTQRTGRHLVISKSWARDITVFQSIDFSKLRSLTVSGPWKSFFISESMKLLRVLDLEDAEKIEDKDLLKNIIMWFPRLKFLSLRGHAEISHLPSSVGDLRQLQTLDVKHTSIVTMPVNITKLQNLQYIRAGRAPADLKPSIPQVPLAQIENQQNIPAGSNAPGDHNPSTPQVPVAQLQNQQDTGAGSNAPADQKPSKAQLPWSRLNDYCRGRHLVGVEMPPGIGKLTALHTLGVVNVRASGTKAFLKDLKMLTQLRKLGVSGINKNNSKKFFSAVEYLVHLESLSLQLDKGNEGCLEGIQLPLKRLRSLKLHGLGSKLPAWFPQLSKLAKIDLEMEKILKEIDVIVTPEDSAAQKKSIQEIKIEKQGCMKFLGTLPELCILRIRAKKFEDDNLNVSVSENKTQVNSYQKVKILEVACSSDSKAKVTFGSKALKKLELLKVDCSTGSKYEFEGLKNLNELREVSLKGSEDDNTLKDVLENELKLHTKAPVVKKLDRSNYSSTSR